MSRFRLLFLLAVALMSSGYKFRCWWMCQDQTAVQNDYIEQRDRCRQYAQLKLDMASRSAGENPNNPQSRNARLISLFSSCMAQNGWNTTDVKAAAAVAPLATPGAPAKGKQPDNAPAALAGQAPATPATTEQEDRAALARKAECAFARQSASVSSLAATRAKACDLECAQRLKLAPDAPRPAACPSGSDPGLESGGERTY